MVSPLFKQQTISARDRDRARTLKALLEANAKWNAERRESAENDLRQIVEETSTINPELGKELLYSWEREIVEDKPTSPSRDLSANLLRKDDNRKSGAALTNPLKGTVALETPALVTTAAGSIYRKSDM